jgi:hypothetical protein
MNNVMKFHKLLTRISALLFMLSFGQELLAQAIVGLSMVLILFSRLRALFGSCQLPLLCQFRPAGFVRGAVLVRIP